MAERLVFGSCQWRLADGDLGPSHWVSCLYLHCVVFTARLWLLSGLSTMGEALLPNVCSGCVGLRDFTDAVGTLRRCRPPWTLAGCLQ